MFDINAKVHVDGRKIIRCKTEKAVYAAIAAGAIAHLISGSVSIKINNGTAEMWSSGSSTAEMRSYGNSTTTMRSYGNSTAAMWSFDNSTAEMRSSGNSTAAMAWLSIATPDAKTQAALTYQIAAPAEANANICAVLSMVREEKIAFDMANWHSQEIDADQSEYPCGTTHCMAGTAIILKGEQGREMERIFGTETAGKLILGAEAAEYFTSTNEEAMQFMQAVEAQMIEAG